MTRATKNEIKKILVLDNKPINLSIKVGNYHLYFTSYEKWEDYINKLTEKPIIYHELKAYKGVGKQYSQQLAEALKKPYYITENK